MLSLVPIAFVYAIAHYFSLFVIQGQYRSRCSPTRSASGWDLFGTADFRPDIAI